MTDAILTQERLKYLLNYDSETGIFTYLKPKKSINKVGEIVGVKHNIGYLTTWVDRKKYYLHRLAWLYVYGEFPKSTIDHINRNKSDNRIENLRLATKSENGMNKTKYSNNKSGFKGVCWSKSKKKWIAQSTVNGKTIRIGSFSDINLASQSYLNFARENHGDFYMQH